MPESKELSGPIGEALICMGKAQQYLLDASRLIEGGSFKTASEIRNSLLSAMQAHNELVFAASRCLQFADVARNWYYGLHKGDKDAGEQTDTRPK